jgi:hypothetical protein
MYRQLHLENIKVEMHAKKDNQVAIRFKICLDVDDRFEKIWTPIKACPFCGHAKGLKRVR